jgi:antirestriction protein ArdC
VQRGYRNRKSVRLFCRIPCRWIRKAARARLRDRYKSYSRGAGKGQVPWRKLWRTLPPANLVKKPYRGISVFLLALTGYGSQYWLTYRQAQALGGNVRKGEHGAKIVFWKFDKYETETADGVAEERKSAFLRYYTVFNLEQTEGLKALLALPPARPIESAEAIVAGMPNPPAFDCDTGGLS